MIDYNKARMTMVDCQIRPNDVTNHAVIAAFMSVPREKFVSTSQKPLSYIDEDLPVSVSGTARYLMEPMSLAKLVQLAEIESDNIVLDIGCATGYSTAILSQLCTSVVAVEQDGGLVEQASQTLMELNCDNAVVVQGDLEKGYAKEGPYDAIFVGGAVQQLPELILNQLKDGGRLVVVEGTGNTGVAKVYKRSGGLFAARVAFNCSVMPLPGFNKVHEFVF